MREHLPKMKDIQSVQHIKDLSLDQLEYLVKFHERYLQDITRGNVSSVRHEAYATGNRKDRNALKRMLPVGVFTHEQSQYLLSACFDLFGSGHEKYFDYVLCVLLPEVMIKIVMHLRCLDHRAAELYIRSQLFASE